MLLLQKLKMSATEDSEEFQCNEVDTKKEMGDNCCMNKDLW